MILNSSLRTILSCPRPVGSNVLHAAKAVFSLSFLRPAIYFPASCLDNRLFTPQLVSFVKNNSLIVPNTCIGLTIDDYDSTYEMVGFRTPT
jgi:hypothetical protein